MNKKYKFDTNTYTNGITVYHHYSVIKHS